MIEIAYLVLFLGASFSIGRRFLGLLKLDTDLLEETVFGMAIGFLFVSLLTLLLGILGFIYNTLFIGIFIIGVMLFIIDLPYLYGKIQHLKRKFSPDTAGIGRSRVNIFLILLLVFLALINIIPSLAPPWGFDETAYHLAVPKIYLANHSITYLPSVFASNFPFLAGMIYLFAMSIKNAILARLVSYSFGIILALAIISFCKRYFSKRIGLFSALIFLTMPISIEIMTRAGTDMLVGLFCFLAAYSFIRWYHELHIGWIVLSGIMVGAAFSTKQTGIIIIFPLVIFLLYRTYRFGLNNMIMHLILFCGLPFLIFVPWMLKSFVFTGNPFFPFLYSIFGGQYLNSQVAESIKHMTHVGFGIGLRPFLLLPWNLTMHPSAFSSIMGIGPIFLAMIPLLLFTYDKNKNLNILLIISFISLTLWFFLNIQSTRYSLFIYSFLSIVSGFVIDKIIRHKSKIFTLFILSMLITYLGFSLALWAGLNLKTVPSVFGLESEEQFFSKLKDYNLYEASMFINSHTAQDAKIMIVKDSRGFYLDRGYIPFDIKYSAYVDYASFTHDAELLNRVTELGITHMMFNDNLYKERYKSFDYSFDFYNDDIAGMFFNITLKHATKLYSKNNIEVFELK